MNDVPQKISLDEWDARYRLLEKEGCAKTACGGRLGRHVDDGDTRLLSLMFDNSPAALDLWNFLLTEEERLFSARSRGKIIIGTMKDLGTVPVMAYSLPNTVAFYPDGAWWVPCVMETNTRLLAIADRLGIDESFCPVRAMLGAFETGDHFPLPDLLICSVGAVCDDFSAIAQRLDAMGHHVFWWEMPHRRRPGPHEPSVMLTGGLSTTPDLVAAVRSELARIAEELSGLTGVVLDENRLSKGITHANRIRATLQKLRGLVFTAPLAPLPALEILIAEMLAIHYCSDREETERVLAGLCAEVERRISAGIGHGAPDAVRTFWVNPVADLRVMNVLEECGGRLCGTDFMFTHALDEIPVDIDPLAALARMALADPMVGPTHDRAARIVHDIHLYGAEAVVISKIPGASHCGIEGRTIGEMVARETGLPLAEIEVPPLSDASMPSIRTRCGALVETARAHRGSSPDRAAPRPNPFSMKQEGALQ